MNILILTASTGRGHKRAAAAIEAKIRQSHPETTVTVVDALKSIGKMYNKTVCGGYHFMATKVPKVYGECYKITDRKNIIHKAVMKSNTMMSKKLLETIESCNPDIIIICHPFVTTMISRLKAKGKLDGVITQNIDGLHQLAGSKVVYEVHGSTLRNYCDRCGKTYPSDAIYESEEAVPHCSCGGKIRPDVTLYGEMLPEDAWAGAGRLISRAELL